MDLRKSGGTTNSLARRSGAPKVLSLKTAPEITSIKLSGGATLREIFDGFLEREFPPSILYPTEGVNFYLVNVIQHAQSHISDHGGRIERHSELARSVGDISSDNEIAKRCNVSSLDVAVEQFVWRPFWYTIEISFDVFGRRGDLMANHERIRRDILRAALCFDLHASAISGLAGGLCFVDVGVFTHGACPLSLISSTQISDKPRNRGGNPGKYEFDDCMDELVAWTRLTSGILSKKEITERLVELDFYKREKRAPGSDEVAEEKTIRAAADFLRSKWPRFYNSL